MPATKSKGRSVTSRAKQASKAKAAAAEPGKREQSAQRNLELAPKIKEARDKGMSWTEIKDKYGVDQPKGQVLIKMASLRPKDRIKYSTEKELAKIIIEKRDKEELSWADIAVRAGVTIGKVKALYESTGKSAADSVVGRKAAPAAKAAKPKGAAKGAAKGKGKGSSNGTPAKRRRRREAADPSPKG